MIHILVIIRLLVSVAVIRLRKLDEVGYLESLVHSMDKGSDMYKIGQN